MVTLISTLVTFAGFISESGQAWGPRLDGLEVFISRPSWRYLPTVYLGGSSSGPAPRNPWLSGCTSSPRPIRRVRASRGLLVHRIGYETEPPLPSFGSGVVSPPHPICTKLVRACRADWIMGYGNHSVNPLGALR